MKTSLLIFSASLLIPLAQSAEIVAQWNFNSPVPDGAVATGTTQPVVGGGAALLVGGVTGAFATGDTAAAHDPAGATDNSGWQTSGYPGAGTNNLKAGVQLNIDTTGYERITLSWFQRHSPTASRYFRVQWTANGADFQDGPVLAIGVDSVFTNQTVDLSGISAANNNPQFGFRLIAEFESTALGGGNEGFVATKTGSTYSASGTMRLDMVTVWGQRMAGANLPPTISSLANVTARVNSTIGPLAFVVDDPETGPEGVTLSAAVSDFQIVVPQSFTFAGSGANRTLTFSAGAKPGSATLTLTARDGEGRTAQTQFRVDVRPENTCPTLSLVPRTNALAGATIVIPILVADLETPAEELVVSASAVNKELVPDHGLRVVGSGTNRVLEITPSPGGCGITPVLVTVTDATESAQATVALAVSGSASVLLDEPFSYPNGSVVANSAYWTTRSGTVGQCETIGGSLRLSAKLAEDVVAPLPGGPFARSNSTVLYAAFALKALTLPKAAPGLLAHFADGSTLRGRLYVGTTNAAPGMYRLGVANGAGTVTECPLDLVTNRFYRIVTRYDLDAAATRVWVDPANESEPATDAGDSQSAARIAAYGFRQDTDVGGLFEVDDLKAGLAFGDVAGGTRPQLWLQARLVDAGLELSWQTGELQWATAPLGPFSDVEHATSPCVVPVDGTAGFFRLRSTAP